MVPVDRSQLRVCAPPGLHYRHFLIYCLWSLVFRARAAVIGIEGINLWARYSGPKGISLCLFCGIGMALCGCNTWNLCSKREIRRRNYWSCNYVHSVIYIYTRWIAYFSFFSFFLSFYRGDSMRKKIEFIEWEIAWITILDICKS